MARIWTFHPRMALCQTLTRANQGRSTSLHPQRFFPADRRVAMISCALYAASKMPIAAARPTNGPAVLPQ